MQKGTALSWVRRSHDDNSYYPAGVDRSNHHDNGENREDGQDFSVQPEPTDLAAFSAFRSR
jgi:hypothetical protein